jgi:hypothetical protein
MTISLTPTFSDIPDDGPIPLGTLAYLRAELRNLFHELVLVEFVRQKESGSLHGAKLARRIGKDAAVLTRLLGGPGNWTLDTVSDLLAGMGKRMVEARLADLVPEQHADATKKSVRPSQLVGPDAPCAKEDAEFQAHTTTALEGEKPTESVIAPGPKGVGGDSGRLDPVHLPLEMLPADLPSSMSPAHA